MKQFFQKVLLLNPVCYHEFNNFYWLRKIVTRGQKWYFSIEKQTYVKLM